MADWEFNIWLVGPPSDDDCKNSVLFRSYKRPQWVTAAIPKISRGLEAEIEVKVNDARIVLLVASRWLESEIGDPPNWDRYFGEMMEEQRYYEREKTRMRESEEEDGLA